MPPESKVTDPECSEGAPGRDSRAIRRLPNRAATFHSLPRSTFPGRRISPRISTGRDTAAVGRGLLIQLSRLAAPLRVGSALVPGDASSGDLLAGLPIGPCGGGERSATRLVDQVRIGAGPTLAARRLGQRLLGRAAATRGGTSV